MHKQHAWPEGHWNWPVHVSHKHGVRCGQMIWVGGQADVTPEGVVNHPGDLAWQVTGTVRYFERVLRDFDCDLTDLVKLL